MKRAGTQERARPVRFGTSGWRGVLGEEVCERRVAAAASGVAAWLRESAARGPVLIAHDRRFGGQRLAGVAAAVLEGAGWRTRVARQATATPVLARALRRGGAAVGLVFTASHNPPRDHGMKLLDARGASASRQVTRRLEVLIGAALAGPSPPRRSVRTGAPDWVASYRRDVAELLERDALAGLRVVYDAMHGAGAGVLDRVLGEAGARVRVLHGDADLRFGGGAPDPRPERLLELRRRLAQGPRNALGLASDGDADRLVAVDASGRCLAESDALALLIDHLAKTGRVERGLALSIATGSLVEQVARHHGLAVTRHPIGFKYMVPELASGRADVAGEESGGFALGRFSLDKDGMLAGCLLAEVAAREPLARALARLRRRFGRRVCGRVAVPSDDACREALLACDARPPARVQGARVRQVDRRDGLHLSLADGFLMLRASGTEGVVRVYAEASDPARLHQRLRWGTRLLARGRVDTAGGGRYP